jgi:hypothetical protein
MLGLQPSLSEAQAAASCRAVAIRPASEELGLRILGQSRDVACELELVPASEGAGCAALAEQHAALAVMTVRERAEAGSYEVVVCDAVADTEQVRTVTVERSDALGASAAFEAVALVVRSALIDLAATHEARRLEQEERDRQERQARERAAAERARLEAERARAAEERARAEQPEEPQDEEEPADHGPPRPWWFALGPEAVLPAMKTVAPALHARALSELGFLRLGLGVSVGLPGDSRGDDAEARLTIARHTAVALGFVPYTFEPGWTLEMGVHAGVTAISRSTQASVSGVEPTPATTHWSAVFGAELGLDVVLSEPLGVRPHLALDVVPGAPRYVYRDVTASGMAEGETVRSYAAPGQVRLGITLFAEL